MKKTMAFFIGIITPLLSITIFIFMLMPVVGLGLMVLTIIAYRFIYRWMISEVTAAITTDVAIIKPTNNALTLHRYKSLAIKLSFCAGLFTGYLIITGSQEAWLPMVLLFLPIYILVIPIIIFALLKLRFIEDDMPVWLFENIMAEKLNKTPRILVIAPIFTIIAIISIPVITIGYNGYRDRQVLVKTLKEGLGR